MSIGKEVRDISQVGLVGLGTVGCGWAAAYLARGFDVRAMDAAPDAEQRCHEFLVGAWPSLRRLGITDRKAPPLRHLEVCTSIAETVAGCGVVHENAPENLELKRRLFAEIEASASADTIVASSTGGIPPSQLQAEMNRPERLIVLHPFNPPHLVPLVEVVGGAATDPAIVDWAMGFLRSLWKHPIRISKEAPGFLTNRLQFALLREAAHCLSEGIASAQSIEDAMTYGLAPRWAAIGSLTTLTLSGGADGMPAVMDRFGGAIETWWSSLGSPTLSPDMKAKLVAGAAEITHGKSLSDWAAWRDERLVDILERTSTKSGSSPVPQRTSKK